MPDFDKLSPESRALLAKEILNIKLAAEPRAWEKEAYPKQLPPDHPRHPDADPITGACCGCDGDPDWKVWLWMSGRSCGKTLTGSNWAIQMALSEPNIWVGVGAPTYIDVKRVCFEGPSGIQKVAKPGEIADYNLNNSRFTMRNGSVIQGYSGDRPNAIRGANLAYFWLDEGAFLAKEDFYDFGLLPALRISKARLLITTTPHNCKLMRDLIKSAKDPANHVHLTHAVTEENWKSKGTLDMAKRLEATYGKDSFISRVELLGQLITDLPGQLFSLEDIVKNRITEDELPELRNIVVAVDPATTSNRDSDETGIVVVGEGVDRHFYTLQDASCKGSVEKVMQAIVAAYYRWDATWVVVEKNVAGDWFRQALYDKDPHIPYRPVQAMKAKTIRAQPISPLMERGLIHMVGKFETLERQLIDMSSYDDRVRKTDDRADAWVWGMRELAGMGHVDWGEVYGFRTCQACGAKINIRLDKGCKSCGSELPPEEPQPQISERSIRWSNAYMNTCSEGHEYAMRLKRCPKCHGEAEYLNNVARFTGAKQAWVDYNSGSNWPRGRF